MIVAERNNGNNNQQLKQPLVDIQMMQNLHRMRQNKGINLPKCEQYLSLVLTALFIYFILLPKVTYHLNFKVICDLRL
jgi:hypothetical protein